MPAYLLHISLIALLILFIITFMLFLIFHLEVISINFYIISQPAYFLYPLLVLA